MFELVENSPNAVIRVIGVGGGGAMPSVTWLSHVDGVDFVANTDAQRSKQCQADPATGRHVTKA